MKINILLIFYISLFSFYSYANPLDSIQDTVPFDNPEYIGNRVAIVHLKINPDKNKDLLKIEYTAINTGRRDLLFGKEIAPPPRLVVNFDTSIQQGDLMSYAIEIRNAIINSDFHVAAGKISKRNSIKIPVKTIPTKATPIEPIVENEDFDAPVMVKKAPEKLVEKAAPIDDFENSLAGAPKKQYDEDACSDLVFESIKVVKKSKNKVTLEYTIVNQGEGPAKLIKNQKKAKENMALHAYMSSKDRVTKSSFSFDGDFIGKGLDKSNGKLYPGERYTNTIKLNIQKMTKFTPYVILELDPYLSVFECDKKNNKLAVKVGEGNGIQD